MKGCSCPREAPLKCCALRSRPHFPRTVARRRSCYAVDAPALPFAPSPHFSWTSAARKAGFHSSWLRRRSATRERISALLGPRCANGQGTHPGPRPQRLRLLHANTDWAQTEDEMGGQRGSEKGENASVIMRVKMGRPPLPSLSFSRLPPLPRPFYFRPFFSPSYRRLRVVAPDSRRRVRDLEHDLAI